MAADDKPINLVAAFKEKVRASGKRSAYVEITATDLIFDPSEKRASAQVATAIKDAIQSSLLAGVAPDGSPMPMVAPKTTDRREARDRQAGLVQSGPGAKPTRERVTKSSFSHLGKDERGDAYGNARHLAAMEHARASGRYRDEKARLKDLGLGIRRRFNAPRLGAFDPRTFDNQTWGRESGMLARSLVVVASGTSWLLKFAGPRSHIDKYGSAVSRVFSKINLWTVAAQNRPEVQAALKDLARNLFATSQRALNSIRQTIDTAAKIRESLGGGDEGDK